MTRIVRENYPVAELPESLREGLSPGGRVRVTLEADEVRSPATPVPLDLDALFAQSVRTFETTEQVVDHVRTVRQEWD